MALDDKQHRYLERFFPGLVAAVEGLGAGTFEWDPPKLQPSDNGGLRGFSFRLMYKLADTMRVDLRFSLRRKDGLLPYYPETEAVDLNDWVIFHYALHYGRGVQDCVFRFDLDRQNGHHVHMRPNPDLHVPCDHVEPDVRDMDPRKFVGIVAAFRRDGTYPVRKKP
jgi:hypothetical protein